MWFLNRAFAYRHAYTGDALFKLIEMWLRLEETAYFYASLSLFPVSITNIQNSLKVNQTIYVDYVDSRVCEVLWMFVKFSILWVDEW